MTVTRTIWKAAVLMMLVAAPMTTAGQSFDLPGRDSSQLRTSPNGFVGQTIGTNDVYISYGRPYVRGRQVFGGLQPYGQVWRSGANEATAISIPADATIEGEALPAGVYSLFTIPGESEWVVIFNKEAKIWGTRHDPDNDVLRVTVAPRDAAHAEMLTYTFEDVTNTSATVVLHWATTVVPFKIAFGE
jgi:hypothetical protein